MTGTLLKIATQVIRGVARVSVLAAFLVALLASGVSGVTGAQAANVWPFDASAWSASGPTTKAGLPDATQNGSGVSFNYNYSKTSADYYGASWTFDSTSPTAQTLTFHWNYSGCHSWFMTVAKLTVYADGPSGRVGQSLYNDGGGCGFNASGTATVQLSAGGHLDFVVYGRNYDYSQLLYGTVTITPSDTTAPTTTATISGTAGNNGWYRSNVSVGLSATDPDDAVSSIKYALDGAASTTVSGASATVPVSGDATHSLTYSATDSHGNVEVTKSLTIKIDTTPPTITYTGNGSYGILQTVSVSCTATDNLSGVATTTCPDTVTGPAYSFNSGSNAVGPDTATDVAGNSTTASTSFTVTATFSDLCGLTKQFTTDSNGAQSLCVKLSNAEAAAARGDHTAQDNVIKAYLHELNAQSGKTFTASQVGILTNLAKTLL